jgi:hypothetical protein
MGIGMLEIYIYIYEKEDNIIINVLKNEYIFYQHRTCT